MRPAQSATRRRRQRSAIRTTSAMPDPALTTLPNFKAFERFNLPTLFGRRRLGHQPDRSRTARPKVCSTGTEPACSVLLQPCCRRIPPARNRHQAKVVDNNGGRPGRRSRAAHRASAASARASRLNALLQSAISARRNEDPAALSASADQAPLPPALEPRMRGAEIGGRAGYDRFCVRRCTAVDARFDAPRLQGSTRSAPGRGRAVAQVEKAHPALASTNACQPVDRSEREAQPAAMVSHGMMRAWCAASQSRQG